MAGEGSSMENDNANDIVPLPAIFTAINKADLSIRMQRDFLTKEFADEIRQRKFESRKKLYIMRNNIIMRLFHLINGERASNIRRTKLTEAQALASENLALASCVDISSLEANTDMSIKLKHTILINKGERALVLSPKELQFVMTFNPEAFNSKLKEAVAQGQKQFESEA